MQGRQTSTLIGVNVVRSMRPCVDRISFLVDLVRDRPLICLKAGLQRRGKMTHTHFQRHIMTNKTQLSALRRTPWWGVLLGATIALPLAAQPNAEPVPGDYRVVQGKVDRGKIGRAHV